MNYLAYYEVLESSGFSISDDLEKLKGQWCFAVRIFEIPDELTMEEFNSWEKPRFPKVKEQFKQVYSQGNLIHEK